MPLTSTAAPSFVTRAVRASVAVFLCLAAVAGLSSGCLDRPVAEIPPRTSDIFIDQLVQNSIDKIDLLFMIDNSISMADKQVTLQAAVPQLVDRLVTPICVNGTGVPHPQGAKAEPNCPTGYQAEFKPILDIHIGIVSSSLGGHGGDQCEQNAVTGTKFDPTMRDNGHLIGDPLTSAARANANPPVTIPPTFDNLGFLAWGPEIPGAESDPRTLKASFQSLVVATGEKGCGYEASLEAWYRFLIDPDPLLTVRKDGLYNVVEGRDDQILAQRAAFLRPDSLVAIIMLTDENDCSVRDQDGAIGYFVTSGAMPKGTSACNTDPNDPCCRLCIADGAAPSDCTPVEQDPNCKPSQYHDGSNDEVNLKCFDQKRRFGEDLLWPTSRYVEGLTQAKLPNYRDPQGEDLPNPLFEARNGKPARSRDLIFLAGIIGVPWQDIATEDTLNDPGQLKYMKYQELVENNRWQAILGDPAKGVAPTDPLMRESVDERRGENPITKDALAPSSSNSPQQNPINGHEADYTSERKDLQYACIYERPMPQVCTGAAGVACDCNPGKDQQFKRPLCQPAAGGPVGTTQYFAKAYPGTRHLQVLRDFGAATKEGNSIVASICPKIQNVNDAAGGYNPAVSAIIERLKDAFTGKCLTRALKVDDEGNVPCAIVETLPASGKCGSDGQPEAPGLCDVSKGRGPVNDKLLGPVRERLRATKVCGKGTPVENCADVCMCEILPAADTGQGGPRWSCQNDVADNLTEYGYCYIDPLLPPFGQGIGNPELVGPRICEPDKPHRLRFIGKNTPVNGSVTFFACLGAPVVSEVPAP